MIIRLSGVSKMKLNKIIADSQVLYADTYLSNVIGGNFVYASSKIFIFLC